MTNGLLQVGRMRSIYQRSHIHIHGEYMSSAYAAWHAKRNNKKVDGDGETEEH